MLNASERERFERVVLPHLDAAFNLARWILRSRADAEDVTQEGMLRAYKFFSGFQGEDGRAWLMQIVRNCCYTWLEKRRPWEMTTEIDDSVYPVSNSTPETLVLAGDERRRLTQAIESIPARSREVLVLRELEGYSYKEIAEIVSIPIGTVMSTLARARERLQHVLAESTGKAVGDGL